MSEDVEYNPMSHEEFESFIKRLSVKFPPEKFEKDNDKEKKNNNEVQ